MPSGIPEEEEAHPGGSPQMARAKLMQSRSMEIPVPLSEDEEEKIRMMIINQRREAQAKKETTPKRRHKADDIAKSIAQAKKDHEQSVNGGGAVSNRSSVISTSSFRREHDRAQSSESDWISQMFEQEKEYQTGLVVEKEPSKEAAEEAADEGTKKEGAQDVEVVPLGKDGEGKGEKKKPKERGTKAKRDKETEAKRAEILAQREAKLRRRRTLDLSTFAEIQDLKTPESTEADQAKDDKHKLRDKTSSVSDPGHSLKRSGSAEVRRRSSKNVKRSKSKRHSTIGGTILAEDGVSEIAVVTTLIRATTISGPTSPEHVANRQPSPNSTSAPAQDIPSTSPPMKVDLPVAQEVPPAAAPPTPRSFKEKLREQFSSTSLKSSQKFSSQAQPSGNVVVTSAIESQRFRRTFKSSGDSDDQRRRLSSIISMFESRKFSNASDSNADEEGSKSKWSALKRSLSSKKHEENSRIASSTKEDTASLTATKKD